MDFKYWSKISTTIGILLLIIGLFFWVSAPSTTIILPKTENITIENVTPQENVTPHLLQCSLQFIRVLPRIILNYCYNQNKSESITIFDKVTTNSIHWAGQDLTKVRNFLKLSFENFDKCMFSNEHYFRNLEPHLQLQYSKNGTLEHGYINRTYFVTSHGIRSMYKLLCY